MRIRPMKRCGAAASLLLALLLCGCGLAQPQPSETQRGVAGEPAATPAQTELSAPPDTPEPEDASEPYPYEDGQGRTRHRLIVNGEALETAHLPFSLSGEKGAYYPLADVLACFGVDCLTNQSSRSATGRVNGQVFRAQARVPEMAVGKKKLDAAVTPQYVDGCLYVPSYLFMELLGATVDFTADRSGCTLDTDIAVEAGESTPDGLTLADNTFGDGSVELTLDANGQAGCVKLYAADDTQKGRELLAVFIDPEHSVSLRFSAGTYILKLAYGSEWLGDDEAFGESGSYSATEAYTFKKGGRYTLESSETKGDFYMDSLNGFLGG